MRDGDGAEADADRGGGQVDLGNRDARHSEAVDGDVGAELGADRGNVDGGDNDGAQSAGEGEVQERRLGKHGGAVGEAEQALVVAPPEGAVAVVAGDEGAGVDVAGVRWGRRHQGLDIKVYIGDTIRAAFSGKVRVVKYDGNGYGKYIVIRHNNGLETIYGHLSKQIVSPNQTVRAGQPIGLGGNTGRSTGSHLHFETL